MLCEHYLYEADAFFEEEYLAEQECEDLKNLIDVLEVQLEASYGAFGSGAGVSAIDIGAACQLAYDLDQAYAQFSDALKYWDSVDDYGSSAESAYESCLEECGEWALDFGL